MKIVGNKICSVCMELNNKKRNKCQKCGNILKHIIRQGTSAPKYLSKEQLKENKYNFSFSETDHPYSTDNEV